MFETILLETFLELNCSFNFKLNQQLKVFEFTFLTLTFNNLFLYFSCFSLFLI